MRTDGSSVTMHGRAATDPSVTSVSGIDRVSVRVVSTERRYDEGTGQWVDGDEYGAWVVCWRQLAAGVLQHVRKGDPLVVTGRLSTRKFERNGVTEYFTDVKADTVALDVGRVKDRIRRGKGGESSTVTPATVEIVEQVDELEVETMSDAEGPALVGVG